MSEAKFGFEMRRIRVPLDDILPIRKVKDADRAAQRYKTILASIKHQGLVEPLIVHAQKGAPGKFVLLDGHQRWAALKELGHTEAECIVSLEDECFTYNARVNRLNPIQEHKMIVKAVQNGVPPEQISAALNIPVSQVKAAMTLLDGIHEEAADILKDKPISPKAIRLLKKVTAVRQIEIAELMASTNNYVAGYAEALVLATSKDQLVNPDEPKKRDGMTAEEIARMEEEMEALERDLKSVEATHAENNLHLTIAMSYIKKLLQNAKVVRFLTAHHGDIMGEFEKIAAAEGV